MPAEGQRLAFLRLGLALVCVGVIASTFMLATMQAAYSPFALPLPSGPFDQLASEAFGLAVATFVFVALFESLGVRANLRPLLRVFSLASIGKLSILAFAAANGMMAIQASDPRALAPKLFAARTLMNLLLLASLFLASRVLLRAPKLDRGSSE